jgi:trk system potassium uptake protein TrkH
MLFSVTLLPPVVVSLLYQDGQVQAFLAGMIAVIVLGFVMWLPAHRCKQDLRVRDGFLLVTLFWMVLGIAGAIPLVLSTNPTLSITDAIFESFSGLTTTGATVITGLDDLPLSILFYRQQLQWLGGMGIIVLAVAIMPMLGIGGMQLYRAETPGPLKDNKLTPRITETAKALWYIYLTLTVACAVGYWLAGMSGFDAIGHSFSTVAIGGFSTHDQSMGYFQSSTIEMIAVVFMLLAGMNFALHFMAWRSMSLSPYRRIFRLAGILASYAVVRKFCWRLCRFNRGWYEGDSLPVAGQAGSPGNHAPDSSECTNSRQGWQQADARSYCQCYLGILCSLCGKFCSDYVVPDGNRAGPDNRLFRCCRLYEQSGPGSGRCRSELCWHQ